MKKFLILLLALTIPSFISGELMSASEQQATVYVVVSPSAFAYHRTVYCSAVKRATHPVKEVTLTKAREMGRTPCRICYK